MFVKNSVSGTNRSLARAKRIPREADARRGIHWMIGHATRRHLRSISIFAHPAVHRPIEENRADIVHVQRNRSRNHAGVKRAKQKVPTERRHGYLRSQL